MNDKDVADTVWTRIGAHQGVACSHHGAITAVQLFHLSNE